MFICILTFTDKLYRVIIAYISSLIKYRIILSLPICTLATTLYCVKESKCSNISIFKVWRYRNNFHNLSYNFMILSWNILESSEYGRYVVQIFRNTVSHRTSVSDKIKLNDRRKENSKKSCKIISACDSPITFLKKEETTCNNSTWLQIELMQLATV